MSLPLTHFVKRPGVGRAGRPVSIRSNFFPVAHLPDVAIHHYDITISSDMPPAVNRRLFDELIKAYRESDLGGANPVFDGRKNMFSSKELPFESRTFDASLCEEGTPRPNRPIPVFKVKVKKVAEIRFKELEKFLEGKSPVTPACLTAIQSLDILIRHRPAMLYTTIGRSFYTPDGSVPLYGSLEAWRGFYSSARPTPGRMMVNVNITAAAFHQSISLLETVIKILDLRQLNDLRRTSPPLNWIKVERAIKQLRVTMTHRRGNLRGSRITGLSRRSALETTFKMAKQDGTEQEISVAEYFKQAYNRTLDYPMLPCVRIGRETLVPIEACKVLPGQRYLHKLNEAQTADMIKFTCQNPTARANTLKTGLKMLNYRDNEYLKDVGVTISEDMVQIPARVLPPPTVCYRPDSQQPSFTPLDGTWNLNGRKFVQGAKLQSWGVVVFGTERDCGRHAVASFVRELVTCCTEVGMNIMTRDPPITYANPRSDIEGALKLVYVQAGKAAQLKPQLLVCILPNAGVSLYVAIKRVTDTVLGVSSQCLQQKHIPSAKKPYLANISMKINHQAPSDTVRPSIAAMVGSINADATRYTASIRLQSARTDIIADFADMAVEHLKAFFQATNKKPQRILVYRDGLSEGEFPNLMKTEIASLRAGCQRLDPEYNPAITFIIIQKRHHARFFPVNQQNADRSGNCKAGTVVDTTIVHPIEFNFYIQSHAGLIGTSRPTLYHVLQDDNRFSADELQTLTYNLCYLYARSTCSVSMVPAAYYAHIVASRARYHAKAEQWSETMSGSTEVSRQGNYAELKADLMNVMWFM
ncbi:Eukaryotic translation initiation factor 2C [Podila horticola]|nr:Eukaryotic translation initiation factor 2C [Podila horticola]